MKLYQLYSQFDTPTVVLISLAVILASGFLLTRITKLLHLPNVTGYILAGILLGPDLLGAVSPEIISGMSFVSDIALAFIAFGVGKFFKLERLKKTGWRVIVITLMQSVTAGILVTLAVKWIFGLSWSFSLLLGAIATATAPASTMMTINQYHARGEFVDTLLQVIALDDVICLLLFSVVAAVVGAENGGNALSVTDIVLPVVYNIGAIALGTVCGFVTGPMMKRRKKDNKLIIVTAVLFAIAGVCSVFGVSPLLSCMVYGAVYINFTKDKELYHQINHFTPPIMTIFFVLSGLNFDLKSFASIGLIGLTYVIVRIIGKMGGAFLGNVITHQSKEIRNYLGFALVPSAGVAIGLAFLSQRILPEETGNLLMTIILASAVVYELIGPVCARFALFHSGCIKPATEQTTENVIVDSPPVADTVNSIETAVAATANAVADVEMAGEAGGTFSDKTSVPCNVKQSDSSGADTRTEGSAGIVTLIYKNNYKK